MVGKRWLIREMSQSGVCTIGWTKGKTDHRRRIHSEMSQSTGHFFVVILLVTEVIKDPFTKYACHLSSHS